MLSTPALDIHLRLFSRRSTPPSSKAQTTHIYHAITAPTPIMQHSDYNTPNHKPQAARLEIRNTATITPIALRTPTQRIILRPTNLTRLRILVAFEFRPRANWRIGMEFFALLILLELRLRLRGLGLRRLVDSRGAEGPCGSLLEVLEDLLFFFRQARRRRHSSEWHGRSVVGVAERRGGGQGSG